VGPVRAGWSGPVAPDDSHGWVGWWPAWFGRGGVGRPPEGWSALEGSPVVSRPWLWEISDHRRRQREERLAAGPRWCEHGLVFTTKVGTPVDAAAASRRFGRLQDDAGVTRHRLYDTRHTAASLLLAQGVAARVVMEVLGHSTYQLTMDTYSHVMPTLLQDAADAMDRALAPRGC
jgi:integrase